MYRCPPSLLAFFVGCSIACLVSSQSSCPVNAPLGTKCKTCRKKDGIYNARCFLRVMLTCTYVDGDKVKSCFPAGDEVGSTSPKPTFRVKKSECENNAKEHRYEATITYQMCNDNDRRFIPRPPENFIKYSRVTNDQDVNSLEPMEWDDALSKSTKSTHCREYTYKRTFRPCKSQFRTMTIAMDGNLENTDSPNYCRCFLREIVKSRVIDDVENPSPSPISVPSVPTTFPDVGSPNALVATIESLSDDYSEMDGFVHVDKMKSRNDIILNYGIKNAPISCMDCRIGIFEGSNCQDLQNAFFNKTITWNPWTADQRAQYITNLMGDAASMIRVFDGNSLESHTCKYVALYDSREDDPSAHLKSNAIACGALVPVGENANFCD